MKTKEEILSEFGCPDIPFDENVTMYYPAILSAMDEYAESKAKEAWNAARELDKPKVVGETEKGIQVFEAYKYADYETYKNQP